MKAVLSSFIIIIVSFSLVACKSVPPADIFSVSHAKERNRNTAGKEQAKIFSIKALALHKQKKYAESETEWKNALKLYADAELYYRFGDTLFNLSRFEDAIKAYKIAIELNHPEKKYVYYNIACAYSQSYMNSELAFKYLELAVKNGYTDLISIQNDPHLSSLAIQCIWGGMRDIDNRLLYPNIFSYFFTNDPNYKIEIAGNWRISIFRQSACADFAQYCFKEDGTVIFLSAAGGPPSYQIKYGIYRFSENKLNIKFSKIIRISNPLTGNGPAREERNINIDENIVIAYKNKDILLIQDNSGGISGLVRDFQFNTETQIKEINRRFKEYSNSNDTLKHLSIQDKKLLAAVKANNIDEVRKALFNNANPNIRDEAGVPVLLVAINVGANNAVKELINKGADINIKDKIGQTALINAAWHGEIQLVKFLLEKGAKINIKDEQGNTALMRSFQLLKDSLETSLQLAKLLIKGEDINAKNKEGYSALNYAATYGKSKLIKLLLRFGADINSQDNHGNTPLINSIQYRKYGIARLLIDVGADVDIRSKYGRTALMGAAVNGQINLVKLLLEKGAYVNVKCKIDGTALGNSLWQQHLDIAKLLLDQGADVNGNDYQNGLSALYWATINGNTDIIKKLISKGAKTDILDNSGDNLLINASYRNNIDVVRLIFSCGININAKSHSGKTALMAASMNGHLDNVNFLIKNGANINSSTANGRTALFYAALYDQIEVVKLLVKSGVDINKRDFFNKSAIILAREKGNTAIVKFLKSLGAID